MNAPPAPRLHSACAIGTLRHRRHHPRPHAFSYPVGMAWLDLAELDRVFALSPWWRLGRPALVRFHRADFLGPVELPLDEAVRRCVTARSGQRPEGPIRMLTQLRNGGHCFNPVTFYCCYDAAGAQVRTLVAEITNTPWGERHAYVLERPAPDAPLRWDFAKIFHVSPFHGMDQRYRWSLAEPGARFAVHMENREDGRVVFDATLRLRLRPMTAGNQFRLLARFPLHTLLNLARIHWQALRLWWRRTPFHIHPAKRRLAAA